MTSALEGLHAIGYARVSTDDKGQDTTIQVEQIKKWAESNGVVLDAVFEEDVSGGVFPRPKLSEALIMVRTSGASMLVCYDQSRLTRDAEHHLPLIKSILGDNKVLRFVVDGDSDPDGLGTKMLTAIRGVTDSEERRKLKERTRLAMEQKRDKEHIHVGRPARVIISDHPEELNRGIINDKTVVLSEIRALSFAAQGWTPTYTANKLLNVPPVTFIRALERAHLTERYREVYNKAVGVDS